MRISVKIYQYKVAVNFHCLELDFLEEGGKTGVPGEKTLGEQQQQQTQPTYDSEFRNRTRAAVVTTPSNKY